MEFSDASLIMLLKLRACIHRQMCTIATMASSSRKGRLSRSTCSEVTITQIVVCAVPDEMASNEHIFPHPHLDNAYIDDREHLQHGWIIFSNPFQAAQPTQNLPTDGYRVINLGRKNRARSGITITFRAHRQVLADHMVFETGDGSNLENVLVECHFDNNTRASHGYINIYHGEDITLGWNCRMEHYDLKIPRMARGIMQSYVDDNRDTRVRRGELPFSIQAKNGTGHSIIGFANDRILGHIKSRRNKPGSGWKWSVITRDGGVHWPTILAITVAIIGFIALFIMYLRYKKVNKLSWICCVKKETTDDGTSSTSSATSATTGIEGIYSNA